MTWVTNTLDYRRPELRTDIPVRDYHNWKLLIKNLVISEPKPDGEWAGYTTSQLKKDGWIGLYRND